jgi:hypothetical protein
MSEFGRSIKIMQDEGSFDAEKAERIMRVYGETIQSMISELREKIREWEALYPEDSNLYSLGLRHAVDFLEKELES